MTDATTTTTKDERLKVELWDVSKLKRYKKNARTHSPRQIRQISDSIKQFGFRNPILCDEDGTIIAGHGRLSAAQELELKRVPVIVLRGMSESEKRAYVLADNKIAENAGWDREMLAQELTASMASFDLTTLGFAKRELAGLGIGRKTVDASAQLGRLEYSVIVKCADEKEQAELLARFTKEGLTCQALIS